MLKYDVKRTERPATAAARRGTRGGLLLLGCIAFSVGVACFFEPCRLAPGGVSGIAIIVHAMLPAVPVGAMTLLINVPLMLVGAARIGRGLLWRTLAAVLLSAFFIDVLEVSVGALTLDPALAAFGGATLVAVGLGLVFRCGATTGGTDIAVKLVRLRIRHVNTGTIFLAIDGAVVLAAWIFLGDVDAALYSALALVVQAIVLDGVLYGGDRARTVFVISEKKGSISERLRNELDVGVTVLYGKGEHSGAELEILFLAVRVRSLPLARDIIRIEDPSAFVVVGRAEAVFGNGFKDHFIEEL